MTLDLFFTLQNLQNGQKPAPVTTITTQGNADLQALSFIDLILSRLTQSAEETGQNNDEEAGLLDSENPALDKLPKLDIAELLAANPEIEKKVKESRELLDADFLAEINDILSFNQIAFLDALKTDGEILSVDFSTLNEEEIAKISDSLFLASEEGEKTEGNVGPLISLFKHIQKLIKQNSPALSATNLTPDQLALLEEQVQQILEDSKLSSDLTGDDAVLGYIVGLVRILPPQARPDVVILKRGVVFAERPLSINQGTSGTSAPANDLGGTLNGLTTQPYIDGEGAYNADDFGSSKDFKDLIKQMAPGQAQPAAAAITNGATAQAPAAHTTSYLQPAAYLLTGSIFAPFEWDGELTNQTIASITGPAALTSPVTQAQAATQAHPATQLIALTLQQQAGNRQNKNLTLQLEPPELGKVEIRMSFSKDKVMKAHMIVEKPETFLMLQRDAHLLERTIQEIGLDSDSGVSFELAEGGYEFGHDGGHDDQGASGKGGADEDGDIEIVESTMTWHVDPATGHTSYNILA